MIRIPRGYRRKAVRQFGEAGAAWLESLPALLTECESRWELTNCVPAGVMSINLVYYARSAQHGDVVLKANGPHGERLTEIYALERFGGDHACRVIESDPERAVMLLERITPGTELRVLGDPVRQLEIGIRTMIRLPVPVTEAHPFPKYRDWLDRTFARQRSEFTVTGEEEQMIGAAIDLYETIDDGERLLLHGDLHHDNILDAGGGQWKAIDPQGVVGPRVMESGRFLENHMPEGVGPAEYADAAVLAAARIGAGIGRSREEVLSALFVLHFLSMCWGKEMRYTRRVLGEITAECRELLTRLDG
jgi:streptomycin 6-kinase